MRLTTLGFRAINFNQEHKEYKKTKIILKYIHCPNKNAGVTINIM